MSARYPGTLISLLLVSLATAWADEMAGSVQFRTVPPPEFKAAYRVWREAPGEPLAPRSEALRGLGFTGRHAEYTGADTWYPSWASDGNLYSPWTDGDVNGIGVSSAGEHARTGHATILGDDPMALQVVDAGTWESSATPYGGRYPAGSLVHDAVWYYGTYCLMNEGGSLDGVVRTDTGAYNWGVLGPFVGFRTSTDYGKTWTETPHTPAKPIFPEPDKLGGPVRIGAPHFVDFGRNMQHSPDGKAYLVAHGAATPDPKPRPANASWITGDCIYLLRVTPSVKTINDPKAYEFYAGTGRDGKPLWTRDFARIKPLLDWNNRAGCVTVTYNAALKRYLMCVTDGWPTMQTYTTSILEAEALTGPWRLVTTMPRFGEQAYFVNFPSKFISADGRTAWLCYSANFSNGWGGMTFRADPPGSRYAMCLQEVRLLGPDDPLPTGPLFEPGNIASSARVGASSTSAEYSPEAAVDGTVAGYPEMPAREWASRGEGDTATIRLTWPEEQAIDRVWLFDRPNNLDQVTAGMLIFGDGSTIATGPLPDDAKTGLEVRFPAKRVRWMLFAVTGVKPGSPNIGLSEIAVFRAGSDGAAKG